MKNGEEKMKVFLRVVVTVLILTALGFGVYAIFFKPAADDVVFLKLSEVMEYKRVQGSDEYSNRRLNEKMEFIATGKRDLETKVGAFDGELLQNYKFLNSQGDRIDPAAIDGCYNMDNKLNDVFNYYFAYTQAAKKVSKSTQNEIQKAIKSYKSSFDDLQKSLNSILSLQNTLTASNFADFKGELSLRYLNAVVKYRANLKQYADLTLKVKDFVSKYVFDGNLTNDSDITKYDIYLYAVQNAMSVDFGNADTDVRKIALSRLADVVCFSEAEIENSGVRMVKPGTIAIYSDNQYTIRDLDEVTGVDKEKDVKIVTVSGERYKYNSTSNKWEHITGKNEQTGEYTTDANDILLGKVTLITRNEYLIFEDRFNFSDSVKGYIVNLKGSKMVECYSYILEKGYLDEFRAVLACNEKDRNAEIMKSEQCADQMRYILACYGIQSIVQTA